MKIQTATAQQTKNIKKYLASRVSFDLSVKLGSASYAGSFHVVGNFTKEQVAQLRQILMDLDVVKFSSINGVSSLAKEGTSQGFFGLRYAQPLD